MCPIFEWRCRDCGWVAEKIQKERTPILCPCCDATMEPRVSVPGYRRDHTVNDEQQA